MKRIFFESHDMKDRIHIYHHTVLKKKPADYVVGFNWHENIEILCIADGAGYVLCNGNMRKVTKEDIFVINAHELHGITTEDTLEYHCVIVKSDFLAANGVHTPELHFPNLIQSKELFSLYMNVVQEITTESKYRDLGIRAQILELFVYLMRNHLTESHVPAQEPGALESIKKSVIFLHREYARKLTLDEIADASGLSKYHFSREFKKATGSTVTSYLNMVRCQHAKLLIASGEHSVHDAAIMCGFTNDSLFSKTFQNVMGCLPSKIKSKQSFAIH